MNFMEAVKAMKEGKKVKRDIWSYNAYLFYEGNFKLHTRQDKIEDANISNICISDIESIGWEIVEEKNKKIPTITENASERKECPYCKKGVLHQHIVIVDKGMVHYLQSLGKYKKEKKTLSDEIFNMCGNVDNPVIPLDKAQKKLKEFIEWNIDLWKCRKLTTDEVKEAILNRANQLFGKRLIEDLK